MYKIIAMAIVLFFPDGEDYLKEMVLCGIDYKVFDPENDVNYTFLSLWAALFKLVASQKSFVFKRLWSVTGINIILRKLRAQLIAEELRKLSPKVVLTFIDNSNLVHLVCEAYKEIPFLAIQNGGRHIWCATDALPDPDLVYHLDEYFCFGPQVQKMFEEYGHDIKKYYTCGPLVAGYFYSNFQGKNREIEEVYDICLVSQWHSHFSDTNKIPKEWLLLDSAIVRMTEYVAQYSNEYDLKVCVALRSKDPAELEFYESSFGGRCAYQFSNRLDFSSYKATLAANLIVAINSTLATESFGVGQKVLFVNPFGEEWLQPTDYVGLWYLSKPNYESFSERVSLLINMDIDAYLDEVDVARKYAVSFDAELPAHVVIRERLLHLINA